jgi:hypothetical protein
MNVTTIELDAIDKELNVDGHLIIKDANIDKVVSSCATSMNAVSESRSSAQRVKDFTRASYPRHRRTLATRMIQGAATEAWPRSPMQRPDR